MTVSSPVAATIGMPLAEFIRLYEQEGAFEYADGERIPLLPGVAEHSELIKLFCDLLLAFGQRHSRITVYSETPYVLTYTSDWVTGGRIPDVMAYDTARLNAYKADTPQWRRQPFVLVPDVTLEVISANDGYAEVDAKVERYIADGVRLIWVVNPRTHTVRVYRGGSRESVRLMVDDTLDGGDVLPGFSLSVRDIFPD